MSLLLVIALRQSFAAPLGSNPSSQYLAAEKSLFPVHFHFVQAAQHPPIDDQYYFLLMMPFLLLSFSPKVSGEYNSLNQSLLVRQKDEYHPFQKLSK